MSIRYAGLSALYNSPQANKSIVICLRMFSGVVGDRESEMIDTGVRLSWMFATW